MIATGNSFHEPPTHLEAGFGAPGPWPLSPRPRCAAVARASTRPALTFCVPRPCAAPDFGVRRPWPSAPRDPALLRTSASAGPGPRRPATLHAPDFGVRRPWPSAPPDPALRRTFGVRRPWPSAPGPHIAPDFGVRRPWPSAAPALRGADLAPVTLALAPGLPMGHPYSDRGNSLPPSRPASQSNRGRMCPVLGMNGRFSRYRAQDNCPAVACSIGPQGCSSAMPATFARARAGRRRRGPRCP